MTSLQPSVNVDDSKTGIALLGSMLRLHTTLQLKDDGEHPLPILRLLIDTAAMRAMDSRAGVGANPTQNQCNAAATFEDEIYKRTAGLLPTWLTIQPRSGAPLRLTVAKQIIGQAAKDLVCGILGALEPVERPA